MSKPTDRKMGPRPARRSATRRGEKGQSLVEMAFAVPVLVLLVAVVIDAARAFDAYIVLTNAAREGARFGSLQLEPPIPDVETLVITDVLGSGTNITHMENFTTTNVTVFKDPNFTKVIVDYDFPLWFGGLLGIPEFHLHKEAVMPTFQEGQ
jgi:Flp pilus assembly protein TadG